MIGGQYRDVRPDDVLDASGLERTSRLKTGALLGASAACGAIVAGAGEREVATARAFGVELGLLFQIVDDILDETGSDEALGKQAGADARRGRRTFASELGLAGRARARRRERARGEGAARRAARAGARPARGPREPRRDARPLDAGSASGARCVPTRTCGPGPARAGPGPSWCGIRECAERAGTAVRVGPSQAHRAPMPDNDAVTRLDQLLHERGLAETRSRAQALVMAGRVRVDGRVVTKAGTAIAGARGARGRSGAGVRLARRRQARDRAGRVRDRPGGAELPRRRRLDGRLHRLPPAGRGGARDRARRRPRTDPRAPPERRPRDRAGGRQRPPPGSRRPARARRPPSPSSTSRSSPSRSCSRRSSAVLAASLSPAAHGQAAVRGGAGRGAQGRGARPRRPRRGARAGRGGGHRGGRRRPGRLRDRPSRALPATASSSCTSSRATTRMPPAPRPTRYRCCAMPSPDRLTVRRVALQVAPERGRRRRPRRAAGGRGRRRAAPARCRRRARPIS